MILILGSNVNEQAPEYRQLLTYPRRCSIQTRCKIVNQ
jgi:hypothetical protein